jgi:hypothetical protein
MKKEVKLPSEPRVFVDAKTNARTLTLPVRLEDGTSAVLMLCRLKDEQWFPEKEIKSITINYLKK